MCKSACERFTDARFARKRSHLEFKGVDLNDDEMSSRLEALDWQALAFELLSSLIVDVRERAVSTREDAWPH